MNQLNEGNTSTQLKLYKFYRNGYPNVFVYAENVEEAKEIFNRDSPFSISRYGFSYQEIELKRGIVKDI